MSCKALDHLRLGTAQADSYKVADHSNAIIDAIPPFLTSSFLGLWKKLNYLTTNSKRLPPHNKSKSYKKQEISPFHPFHF